MLVEAALSVTCFLLYKKTKLKSLLAAGIVVWLGLINRYLTIVLAVVLLFLIKEASAHSIKRESKSYKAR